MNKYWGGNYEYLGGDVVKDTDLRGHGACNHTGYAEFDSLTGYVTARYTREWRDKSGTRWRRTTTVVNLGRPDRGIAVDPDMQLAAEDLDRMPSYDTTIAGNRALRYGRWRDAFVPYLEEHGPQRIRKLMERCKSRDPDSMRAYIESDPMYLRFCDSPLVYGLYGQSYKPPNKSMLYEARADKLRSLLVTYGPMVIGELWKRVGDIPSQGYLHHLLTDRDDVFVKVGKKRTLHGNIGALWGVVGVHKEA